MDKRVLVVDDEKLIVKGIKFSLEQEGLSVDCAYDGEEALAAVKSVSYDVILLDVMLPKLDGFAVLRRLRAAENTTPVLMLTARSEVTDRVEGLDCGADYYLTKPFDSRKLLACINALLRRQGTQVNELTLGNTTLDLSSCTLNCGSNHIRLSAKEFDVMRFLMVSPGQILSKELILCRVWGYDSNAVENHVEVYVGLLRKKLSHIGSNIRIEAVRRLGYLMEASEE